MSGAKILWVDDEIDLLKPHILFLKGKGYDVETCNNGYDAIDLVAARQFDLVILDEIMPEGFQHNVQSLRVVDRLEKDGEEQYVALSTASACPVELN